MLYGMRLGRTRAIAAGLTLLGFGSAGLAAQGANADTAASGQVLQVMNNDTLLAHLPGKPKVGDKYEIYDLAADGYKLVVAHTEVESLDPGKAASAPPGSVRLHIIYLEASYPLKNLRGTFVEPDRNPA
jgi:hypothetical protein